MANEPNIGSNASGHSVQALQARIRNYRRAIKQLQTVYTSRAEYAHRLWQDNRDLRAEVFSLRAKTAAPPCTRPHLNTLWLVPYFLLSLGIGIASGYLLFGAPAR